SWHMPLVGSHAPTAHPTSIEEQSLGVPPTHCPAEHDLPTLQRSPVYTHGLPSWVGSGVATHNPFIGSHIIVLHSASGELLQSLGTPMQVPTVHTPLTVHLSLGAQAVPSFAGVEV